jgi:hypothetical protein
VLEAFAANLQHNVIQIPGSLEILIGYLLQDGLLVRGQASSGISVSASAGGVTLTPNNYVLTPKGRDFVNRWISAQDLED